VLIYHKKKETKANIFLHVFDDELGMWLNIKERLTSSSSFYQSINTAKTLKKIHMV
jgi:hypothetical protein